MSCGTNNKVKLPIDTSVGNLVSIEQKMNVATDGENIAIKPGEILYLLTFNGKSEFSLNGPLSKADPQRALVDQDGKEYWPVYSGSLREDGVISNKEWNFSSGVMTGGEDGQLVFVDGSMTIPKPEFTLIFCVPQNITKLALRDGDKQFPVN
jgi:hypothetical protein